MPWMPLGTGAPSWSAPTSRPSRSTQQTLGLPASSSSSAAPHDQTRAPAGFPAPRCVQVRLKGVPRVSAVFPPRALHRKLRADTLYRAVHAPFQMRRYPRRPLVGGNHLIGDAGYASDVFGQRDESLALGVRSHEAPEMHDAVLHKDVGPAEVSQPQMPHAIEHLDADVAVGFALGLGRQLRGGKRLDEVRAA